MPAPPTCPRRDGMRYPWPRSERIKKIQNSWMNKTEKDGMYERWRKLEFELEKQRQRMCGGTKTAERRRERVMVGMGIISMADKTIKHEAP